MSSVQTSSPAADWLDRYNAAIGAGLTDQEATIFATAEGDLEELAKLVDGGCDPLLIAKIVL